MKLPTALAAFFLFPALRLAAPPKTTDTVKLKNGTTLEGRMIEETAEAVVMEVATGAGKGIMEEKTIPMAEVASVQKAPEEDRAFLRQGLDKLLPTDDLLGAEDYDKLIATKIDFFLKKYGSTPRAADVRKLAESLRAEKEQVAQGDIKLGGQWIPAAEYQKQKIWIDGQIALRRMQVATNERRYGDALLQLQEIEKTWPGTTVLGTVIQMGRKALAGYKTELARSLAELPAKKKLRTERLSALSPEEKTQSEEAYNKEREEIRIKIAEETRVGKKWTTVDAWDESALKRMISSVDREDSRLGAVPTADMAANETTLRDIEKAIADGRLDEALKLLATVKGDAQKMPYFKVLTERQRSEAQRLRAEELAAKKAERDKTAAQEAEQRRKKAEQDRKEEKDTLDNARSPIAKALDDAQSGKPKKKKGGGFSPILVAAAAVIGGLLLVLAIAPKLKKKKEGGEE